MEGGVRRVSWINNEQQRLHRRSYNRAESAAQAGFGRLGNRHGDLPRGVPRLQGAFQSVGHRRADPSVSGRSAEQGYGAFCPTPSCCGLGAAYQLAPMLQCVRPQRSKLKVKSNIMDSPLGDYCSCDKKASHPYLCI